jgi:hypothetical protein
LSQIGGKRDSMNEKLKRRTWAEEQIALLVRQREGLDRRIREYQAFISLLDQSDAALADDAGDRPTPRSNGNGHAQIMVPESLGSRIKDVLSRSIVPMSPREVAEELYKAGFHPRTKTPLQTLVTSELYRQARLNRNGIKLAAPGRFVHTA